MIMASGPRWPDHLPAEPLAPARRFQRARLDVPVAHDHPWVARRAEQDPDLVQDLEVGRPQARADLKVD